MSTRMPALLCVLACVLSTLCATPHVAAGDVQATVQQTLSALQIEAYRARPDVDAVAKSLDVAMRALADTKAQLDAQMAALPTPKTQAERDQIAEQRLALRLSAAQIEFYSAELYRHAIAAAPADDARRTPWLAAGMKHVSELRVSYLDLAVASMGYILESRIQRAAGNLDAARAALAPLLSKTPKADDAAASAMFALAGIERIECDQLTDPAAAAKAAAALLDHPAFADAARQAELRWRIAQSQAIAHAATGGGADMASITKALRETDVVEIAPAYERLRLLSQLEQHAGQSIMSPNERLSYADFLIVLGEPAEAERMYRLAMPQVAKASARQQLNYAGMLYGAGNYVEAADVYDKYLSTAPPDDPQRDTVMQWRDAALAQAGQADGAREATFVARQNQALLQTINAPGDDEVRRRALRSWVGLNADTLPPADLVAMLQKHRELTAEDVYLQYALLAAQYRQLSGDERRRNEDANAAQRIADGLAQVATRASERKLTDVANRATLLRAAVLGAAPLANRLTAVDSLQQHWPALMADPATRDQALGLRLHLLLELGMIDSAGDVVNNLPAGVDLSPALLCRLVDSLAARYPEAGNQKGMVQAQVIRQANRALLMAVTDAKTYVDVARRAASAMVDVAAYADALRIAQQVRTSDQFKLNDAERLAFGLIEGRALVGLDHRDKAMRLLEDLHKIAGSDVPVDMAVADLKLALGEPDEALAAYRAARSASRRGSAEWWQATLGVVRVLELQEQFTAANQVLRAAAVMYPPTHSPSLQAQIQQTTARLEGPPAAPSANIRGAAP